MCPTPNYGEEKDFELVLDLVQTASQGLLKALSSKLSIQTNGYSATGKYADPPLPIRLSYKI